MSADGTYHGAGRRQCQNKGWKWRVESTRQHFADWHVWRIEYRWYETVVKARGVGGKRGGLVQVLTEDESIPWSHRAQVQHQKIEENPEKNLNHGDLAPRTGRPAGTGGANDPETREPAHNCCASEKWEWHACFKNMAGECAMRHSNPHCLHGRTRRHHQCGVAKGSPPDGGQWVTHQHRRRKASECQEEARNLAKSGFAHLEAEGAASLKKPTVSQRDSRCNVRPRQRTIFNLGCHTRPPVWGLSPEPHCMIVEGRGALVPLTSVLRSSRHHIRTRTPGSHGCGVAQSTRLNPLPPAKRVLQKMLLRKSNRQEQGVIPTVIEQGRCANAEQSEWDNEGLQKGTEWKDLSQPKN